MRWGTDITTTTCYYYYYYYVKPHIKVFNMAFYYYYYYYYTQHHPRPHLIKLVLCTSAPAICPFEFFYTLEGLHICDSLVGTGVVYKSIVIIKKKKRQMTRADVISLFYQMES